MCVGGGGVRTITGAFLARSGAAGDGVVSLLFTLRTGAGVCLVVARV